MCYLGSLISGDGWSKRDIGTKVVQSYSFHEEKLLTPCYISYTRSDDLRNY